MELLPMSSSEIVRSQVLAQLAERMLSQASAAQALAISERHVRRLLRRFEAGGAGAIVSQRRGKPPNNRVDDAIVLAILDRCRGDYADFGPTFLAQVLEQRDQIVVSREWLRALMIRNGLWTAHRRKRNLHPLRERRPCFGELVQMDGSPHDWFETRGPRCTLLLAIDDATSRVTAARFERTETTNGYFALIRTHIERYGRFCAAYTDKHSIFRYSGSTTDLATVTQLQRSLDELNIDLICANSPQAKGRVERANRTFQDRLIKAMRLEGIATLDDANRYLPQFLLDHNERFAVDAGEARDAHRSAAEFDLDFILCQREERVVTKNLMIQVYDTCFALTDAYSRRNLSAGSRVEVRLHLDQTMTVHHGQIPLVADLRGTLTRNAPIVGAKDLNAHVNRRIPDPNKVRTPATNHPWRKPFKSPAPPQPDISALQKPDISALR